MNKKCILGFTAAVMCVVFCTAAFASDTFIVPTVTYYINPDTGVTDDGGTGNVELGEGMCRSAVYEKALAEQNENDVTVTLRMLLYSNLDNIRIAVQDEPKGSYTDVKYSVVKESSSADSADLKFTIPSISNYIQIKMYVAPMGRDVCFYASFDSDNISDNISDFSETTEKIEESTVEKTAADMLEDISGHALESAIRYAVENGLFSGTSETTFDPDGLVTRGMFVTVLGRMSGEEISGTSSFEDVDSGKYYSSYIAWASKNGIVSGTSESTFSPDTPVTCEQAASILVRYAEYKGVEFTAKSISPSTTGVSEWAKESVIAAGKAGIITKQNTNGYDYTSAATRADAASMVSNFAQYYGS